MNTFYHHVVVDIPQELVKHMVGRNGVHLKRLRDESNVKSIWYNQSRNIIEIYGPIDCLPYASICVLNHMDYIQKNFCIDNKTSECEPVQGYAVDYCTAMPLSASCTKDDIKYIIGRRGYHFKRLTKEAMVSFIWYDEDSHSILIYGPEQNLPEAVKLIGEHIEGI